MAALDKTYVTKWEDYREIREWASKTNVIYPNGLKGDKMIKWFYFPDLSESDFENGFINGAKWADEHPNINSLWHSIDKEPKDTTQIILLDGVGKYFIIDYYKHHFDDKRDGKLFLDWAAWRNCVRQYNIKVWAYITDLLPKEDNK